MKILKIYSNNPNFKNVTFKTKGLNIILGEITDRNNYKKDTHNLGKSLLIEIIDFLLLKQIAKKEKFFLTKNTKFEKYEFYIELLCNSGKYLIIKRCVENNTKICIKENTLELSSYDLKIQDWNYEDSPIGKAKGILNEYLSFNIPKNKEYPYRKFLDYFLRSQEDFLDVFRLNKFKGKDKDWKPMVLDLLNFDSKVYSNKLDLDEELTTVQSHIVTLRKEHKVDEKKVDELRGIIDIESRKLEEIEGYVDNFNFVKNYDADKTKLVEDLEYNLDILNTQHYATKSEIQKSKTSLETNLDYIDLKKLERLYADIGVFFPKNLEKNYNDLIKFNKDITEERIGIVKENLITLELEEEELNKEILKREKEKSKILSVLTDQDSYEKFKSYQKQLSKKEADLIYLEKKLKIIDQINNDLETEQKLVTDISEITKQIKALIESQGHKEIRKIFGEIIYTVLSTDAVISIEQNGNGNLEYLANYQNSQSLEETDEGKGNSYKKLLCSAFDLALLVFYSKKSFFRCVYHDGILDNLDIRKTENYIKYIRDLSEENNLQYILTVIDSQLSDQHKIVEIKPEEIRLKLNDKDESGTLFGFNF